MDFQFTSEFHHLGQPHDHNTALIILNQPLPNTEYLKSIWTGCNSIRLCADGGANRLFDAFITSNEHGTYVYNSRTLFGIYIYLLNWVSG